MRVTVETGSPGDLTLLKVNARFMPHETFQALVANIRRDGVLTQLPFVVHDPDTGVRTVLSGNHRVKAAIEAGLDEVSWLETTEPLTSQQQVAIQLSHNAITGIDDPAILASLYESLNDLDWRAYSGLDDAMLGLIGEVDIGGLDEVNLDYQTLHIVFLPDELERARVALDEAASLMRADERWLARFGDHFRLLDALATTGAAHNIRNQSVALAVVLDVFEAHREDLADGYMDAEGNLNGAPRADQMVPLSTIFGSDHVSMRIASVLRKAVNKLRSEGRIEEPRQALELLAADYLTAKLHAQA